LRFDSISLDETTATAVIGGHQGHIYQLQRSPDLSPGSWTNTGTPAEGQGIGGNPMPLILTAPKPTGDRYFFRVAVD
jgi:hypothetical protein